MTKYDKFIQEKGRIQIKSGFKPGRLPSMLFPFQRRIVRRALGAGRFAIFSECGTGKTMMQLSWADQVARHTGGKVLILAPLAVAQQTVEEGKKIGVEVKYCRSQESVGTASIAITNYEMLSNFDAAEFQGVVLDESSILKGFAGSTCTAILQKFERTPYKLAASATPSPNDFVELGTHAEFLGVMSRVEMLATFFTHDSGESAKWRLKGHSVDRFWKWVCTWAVMVRRPSDMGCSNDGFNLPPLNYHEHIVNSGRDLSDQGLLFAPNATTLTGQRDARRASIGDRVATAASLVNSSDEPWLVWCDLNAESEALAKAIPGAVEVKGADKPEHKERSMIAFANGEIRVLISKPSICGFGMNFQVCPNMVFVGLSNSFEQIYQATRRCWRFGQKKPVHAHFVFARDEGAVVANIKRKEEDFRTMQDRMVDLMHDDEDASLFAKSESIAKESGLKWTAYNGDCVKTMADNIESNSIDFSIYSPPFSSLYTYSNSAHDIGNCRGDDEFLAHFRFCADELFRVIKPGRLMAVHCAQIPAMKERDGFIGIKDFRGDLIRLFQASGFIFHSEVTIWKDPVVEMQRTKALGLLHKQIKKDSAMSRMGIPDYLVIMRKPGVNPDPITHTNESFPVDVWQRYASPVWFDIKQGNTLNKKQARENQDERHICPLQLGVIERALELWTNPGDLVLSPFMGIGSEGYVSLKMGRKFVGIELKKSYFDVATNNLSGVVAQQSLFDLVNVA